MLLIAQPKSASSSFRDALNRAMRRKHPGPTKRSAREFLPYVNPWRRTVYPYGGHRYTADHLTPLVEAPYVRRLHIPPTPVHRQLFREVVPQCLVILRDPPHESTEAHNRWHYHRHHKHVDKLFLARLDVLFHIFHYEWKALAQELGYFLTYYHEYLADPPTVMNAALTYLGRAERVKPEFRPPRVYYSRGEKS